MSDQCSPYCFDCFLTERLCYLPMHTVTQVPQYVLILKIEHAVI